MHDVLPTTNLAPMKPLFDLKDKEKPTPTYIVDGIKELLKDLLQRNQDTYKEIANTTEITSNFIQGKQLWVPNYWNNTWSVQRINRADPNKISAINIMQFYCTTQLKMITAINPDIEPEEEYRTREYKEKVRKSKAIWNYYERRFYKPWFNQQEGIHAIVSGNYIESVQYDHMVKGVTIFQDIFEKKEMMVNPGYSKCFNEECGYEGTYKEFAGDGQTMPQCPKCGSQEILPPEREEYETFNTLTGVQPVQVGDLSIKLLPIQTFRYDIKVRPEESSWSVELISMSRNKLKYLLGGVDIPSDRADDDHGVRSLRAMQTAGNTISGKDYGYVETRDDDVLVYRICVKPEDVAHIINKKDEETVGGEIIPKGQKLSEFCPPEGMTIYATSKGEVLIGIYKKVHHSLEIASGVLHMRYASGLGRGSEDTVEVQKRFNRMDAQNVRYMDATSTPASTFVTGSVDRKHIKKIGHPGVAIPINQEVAQALGTTELVKHLTPGQLPAQYFSYTYDILNQYRQLTSHSTDFTNAFPGVNNKTATGATLAKTNADSVWSPFQTLKGEVRVGTAHNTLKAVKRHFKGIPREFTIGETLNGQTITEKIEGNEIDCDILFTVKRDTEQPKTPYDRQTDMANMIMLTGNAGGIKELKETEPRLLNAMFKTFDIDIEDNTYDTMADVCEMRLEQGISLMKTFLEFQMGAQMGGVKIPAPDPNNILLGIDPPIILEEPNHDQKAKWFQDFLDTPEGAKLGNLRIVLTVFIREHVRLAGEQAQILGSMVGGAQAAAQEALLEKQRQMAIEQKQAEMAEKQQDQQFEMAKVQNDNQQKELDREHDITLLHEEAELEKKQAVLESGLKIVEENNKPKEPKANTAKAPKKKGAKK